MNKIFEQLIAKRGIDENFLKPKYEDLVDAFLLPDMAKGVERIMRAAQKDETVLIYGDYDVDGVTASTVMEETLRLAGVKNIEIMLPDRFVDGYGMSPKVVKKAKEINAALVVTVDCGSANKDIVNELNLLGIDTVVTDHHECPDELPEAIAVINPKRKDVTVFRDFAGVGVAFMVARGLVQKGTIAAGKEKWLLDLVVIGTMCDSMPLVGQNRILSFYGIKVLNKTRRVGLTELMRQAGVKQINTETIGFQIGPRLNAAGRIESADLALALVRATSRSEAAACANKLEELNKKRKVEQTGAVNEIEERGIVDGPVIIETGEWHEGILGIVAGKLVEKYQKPAFVLTEVAGGIFKGSGRSFGEFSLAEALKNCGDSIVSGGGHAAACGLRVQTDKIWEFRERMNNYYNSLGLENQLRFLKNTEDIAVEGIKDFSLELIDELRQLEPYGEKNTEPIFKLANIRVVEVRKMGADQKHLSLTVEGNDSKTMRLVAFYAPEAWFGLDVDGEYDILIQLVENVWNGVRSVEGRIVDVL